MTIHHRLNGVEPGRVGPRTRAWGRTGLASAIGDRPSSPNAILTSGAAAKVTTAAQISDVSVRAGHPTQTTSQKAAPPHQRG